MYLRNKEVPSIIVEVTHVVRQELQLAENEKQKIFYNELLFHGYRWYSICQSFGTMIYFHEDIWEYISQQQFRETQRGFL